MQKQRAIQVLASLSSGIRLDVYRLLIRRTPDGMVAGEIAAYLDLPPAKLSFHLKALTQARLVTVQQEGRFQRYRANLPLMTGLIAYLTAECCAGQPDRCADLAGRASPSDRLDRLSPQSGLRERGSAHAPVRESE